MRHLGVFLLSYDELKYNKLNLFLYTAA